MKKLALALDELRVETFSVEPDPDPRRGTVHGHDSLNPDFCATGKYAGCDPGSEYTDCGCGGISGYSCDGPSCAYQVDTCAAPCRFSYVTNCHRCQWDSDHTACIEC